MSWKPSCKGDCGYTTLGVCENKEKVPKDHPSIKLIGSLDKIQALLGICHDHADDLGFKVMHETLINDIYLIMGQIHMQHPKAIAEDQMKKFINNLDEYLELIDTPKLNKFILPIGEPAYIHLARTEVRKVEEEFYSSEHEIGPYLNRLSSVLYGLAIKYSYYLTELEEKSKRDQSIECIIL